MWPSAPLTAVHLARRSAAGMLPSSRRAAWSSRLPRTHTRPRTHAPTHTRAHAPTHPRAPTHAHVSDGAHIEGGWWHARVCGGRCGGRTRARQRTHGCSQARGGIASQRNWSRRAQTSGATSARHARVRATLRAHDAATPARAPRTRDRASPPRSAAPSARTCPVRPTPPPLQPTTPPARRHSPAAGPGESAHPSSASVSAGGNCE